MKIISWEKRSISSVNVVTRLWGGKQGKRGYICGKHRDYSLLYTIQTSSGIKPASCPVAAEFLSPACKVARA